MILYLDTSSLLKYYIQELGSASVRTWIGAADVLATSRLTLPEAAAALSRRSLGGGLSRNDCRSALTALRADWPAYVAVDLDEQEAAAIAWRRRLRGYDAVQLAAALACRRGAAPESLAFSSFDAVLCDAARTEGLTVLEPLE